MLSIHNALLNFTNFESTDPVKNRMKRIIIAGGRDFTDYDLLCKECDKLIFNTAEIVCGGASGADALGKRYAQEHKLSVKDFPADWKQHGKAAGPIRNRQMAEYADSLIAFWDGSSRGTHNMILLARSKGLNITIVHYGKEAR